MYNRTTRIKRTSSKKRKIKATETRAADEAARKNNEENVPLVSSPQPVGRNLKQRFTNQTFQSTAQLANLLPTGTILSFRILTPLFTNEGECDSVTRSLTTGLLGVCGMLCFILSFTDSFKDRNENICYGFATLRGLWVVDGLTTLQPGVAAKYRLKLINFVHAFMKLLVFAAIALFDQNVVKCLYPLPSEQAKHLLTELPVVIGVISSMLFAVFPTQRHGIGFPVTAN